MQVEFSKCTQFKMTMHMIKAIEANKLPNLLSKRERYVSNSYTLFDLQFEFFVRFHSWFLLCIQYMLQRMITARC